MHIAYSKPVQKSDLQSPRFSFQVASLSISQIFRPLQKPQGEGQVRRSLSNLSQLWLATLTTSNLFNIFLFYFILKSPSLLFKWWVMGILPHNFTIPMALWPGSILWIDRCGLKAWPEWLGLGGEGYNTVLGLSPLSYLLSLSVCSGCIIKFCFFLLFRSQRPINLGSLQELKTGYKDETDFTMDLNSTFRKTNKQEGLEDPHQRIDALWLAGISKR